MLFSSFSVKGLTLRNRIVMPPMCMYKAAGGMANDWHYIHYSTRAIGQVGLIIVEATGVEPRGRITDNDLGIWTDEQAEGLKKIADAIHRWGGKAAIQLGHAGRKSEVSDTEPVAPSALRFSESYRKPRALTAEEIKEIVAKYAAAARRAVAAGFDAIEIHGAHGYLISEFLSPAVNKRTDEYGGSPENRVRLLGEVIGAVKKSIPADMPIIVRVSAHDYDSEGNEPEVVAEMLNMVKDEGIDLVNVSSGGVTSAMPRAYPGYQIGFAHLIKDRTGLPVMGGGLITQPVQADQVIKSGIDLVYIGRELLRTPYWPLMAAAALGEEVEWPEPYARAKYR